MRGTSLIVPGTRYDKLVVIEAAGKTRWNELLWLCACDCGQRQAIRGKALRAGLTRSCGCMVKFNGTTHGGRNTRLYRIWSGMIQRCENTKTKDYGRYGGAGIAVCAEWRESFETFRAWAVSHGYQDDLFIDRRESAGNYVDHNCRWVTTKESSRNTRAVKLDMQKAQDIRRMAGAGDSHSFIASKYLVSRSLVSLIVEGKLWT